MIACIRFFADRLVGFGSLLAVFTLLGCFGGEPPQQPVQEDWPALQQFADTVYGMEQGLSNTPRGKLTQANLEAIEADYQAWEASEQPGGYDRYEEKIAALKQAMDRLKNEGMSADRETQLKMLQELGQPAYFLIGGI